MKAFLASFVFALRGLRFAWSGRNFRVQCLCGLFAVILGFACSISVTEWIVVIALVGLVLAMEAFNTAIESLVDLVSPEYDPLAGRVKDLSAGAVLLVSAASAVVGAIVFLPYLFPD